MNLFISYASEQHDLADKLAIALTNEGHDVFFDADNLRAGENYNEVLRSAIDGCDQFIYLVSPESVEDGSYARSELQMAQRRFKIAVGHILPVMIVPTDYSTIPNYAKSVTVLEPEGDAVVAVLNRMAEIEKGGISVAGLRNVVGGAILLVAFGIGLYQAFLWAAPRLAEASVIMAVTAAGLVLLALCWILWRRCVVRGSGWALVVPGAVLGLLVAGVWAALVFAPRVVWLVPGTSLFALVAADGSSSLLLTNLSAKIDSFGPSGVYLASNEQAARMIIEESSDELRLVLLAYLEEQEVPTKFHEEWLSEWTAEVRLEGQSSGALADPEKWEGKVRLGATGEKTVMMNWRYSSSISIAFVEVN